MKYLEYATNSDRDTMATRFNWGKNYYVQFDIDMVMNRVNVIRRGCHCE